MPEEYGSGNVCRQQVGQITVSQGYARPVSGLQAALPLSVTTDGIGEPAR